MSEEKAFRKISEKEYEVQLGGRTKTLFVPFGKTEAIFKAFISNGGIINPNTGAVETDIVTLITSFREVGDLVLTEYDDNGKVTTEGNSYALCSSDVVVLFQVAIEIIRDFIQSLSKLTPQAQAPEVPVTEE